MYLIQSKKYVNVPDRWVHNLDIVGMLNDGVHSEQSFLIFYSPTKTKDANFNMPVSHNFCSEIDAVYEATIRDLGGKIEASIILELQCCCSCSFLFSCVETLEECELKSNRRIVEPHFYGSVNQIKRVKLENVTACKQKQIQHLHDKLGCITIDDFDDAERTTGLTLEVENPEHHHMVDEFRRRFLPQVSISQIKLPTVHQMALEDADDCGHNQDEIRDTVADTTIVRADLMNAEQSYELHNGMNDAETGMNCEDGSNSTHIITRTVPMNAGHSPIFQRDANGADIGGQADIITISQSSVLQIEQKHADSGENGAGEGRLITHSTKINHIRNGTDDGNERFDDFSGPLMFIIQASI